MLMKSTDFTSKVISSANLCFSVFEFFCTQPDHKYIYLRSKFNAKTKSLYSEMNCNYGEIHNQKSISKCFFGTKAKMMLKFKTKNEVWNCLNHFFFFTSAEVLLSFASFVDAKVMTSVATL